MICLNEKILPFDRLVDCGLALWMYNACLYSEMFHWLYLLSLHWNAVDTFQRIQPVQKKENNDFMMANCVNVIGTRHFMQTKNVEIIATDSYLNDFEDFGIVVRSTAAEFNYSDFRRSRTKYAVVFLEGIHKHEEDLKTLTILTRFDPQGRFIISFKSEVDPSNSRGLEYLNRIITYLASIEKWNVVILMNDNNGNNRIRIYRYTLFYSSGNCSRIPQLDYVGNCDDAKTLDKLFPVFLNFHKCDILMSIANIPPQVRVIQKNGEVVDVHGVESNLIKLIMKKLNATPKMFLEINGTVMRYNVQIRKVDMSWSGLMQYKLAGTTWTQSYLFAVTSIIIPESRQMPLWMNLILPFQAEVWITLGLMISGHLSIKLLIPSIRKQFPLQWMVSGFFGSGISKLPTRIPQRLYVAYWLIVGYIVTQCYLASLTGFFASPGQYRPMQTLDEVDKSGTVIGGLANMRIQFQDSHPGIFRNYKVLSQPEYFENINKLKLGTGGTASYAHQIAIINITNGREVDFNVIPERISVNPIAILLPDSSPILEGCNRVIHYVVAAGLIKFWQEYEAWELKYSFVSQFENPDYKTSIEHLQAVFIFLGIGHCLSCIVFAVELTISRFSKAIIGRKTRYMCNALYIAIRLNFLARLKPVIRQTNTLHRKSPP